MRKVSQAVKHQAGDQLDAVPRPEVFGDGEVDQLDQTSAGGALGPMMLMGLGPKLRLDSQVVGAARDRQQGSQRKDERPCDGRHGPRAVGPHPVEQRRALRVDLRRVVIDDGLQ